MSKAVMHNVVSVDGYIADDDDDIGPLFEWYSNGDVAVGEGDAVKVSQASADYLRPTWAGIGTLVVGRHVFGMTNGWEDTPPAGEHLIVVSHRPKPEGWHPEAPFHFIDDGAAAIAKATQVAGERTVAVAAGDVGGAGPRTGPGGRGGRGGDGCRAGGVRLRKRHFGPVDGQHLLEDPDVIIRGDRVLPLRFRVRR